MVKKLPANAGGVRDLGSIPWEDPLEKRMATHSNILAWRIPWTEEPGRLQSIGLQRVRQDLETEGVPPTKKLFLILSHSTTSVLSLSSVKWR